MTNQKQSQEFLEGKLPYYIKLLRRMVDINSFTANAGGVDRLAKVTAEIFAQIGFQSEFVQSANPNFGEHLFLSLPRNQQSAHPTIALISHLDTVYPPEEEIQNNFHWLEEGERIYGPGILDIKGGTVMIYMVLDALKTLDLQTFNNSNWLICLNASEETLSPDFIDNCLTRLQETTTACLVFEGGSLTPEAMPLVVARKGRATYRVEVEGRSAHAGNHHHLGANAILQIAHTIQRIEALTNHNKKITFNVGIVSGGSVVNRVPHYAKAIVEMRAFSPEVYREGDENILALSNSSQVSSSDGYPCQVTIQVLERTDPWPRNPDTDKLFHTWHEIAEQIGYRVIEEERGGLSDGNLIWNIFPTIDGLGPSGANAHCSERSLSGSKEQEYVLRNSFVPKAVLNSLAIRQLILSAT